MYCMSGLMPGGSAGTSFCSGTERSISLRAMAHSPGVLVLRSIAAADRGGQGDLKASDVDLSFVAGMIVIDDLAELLDVVRARIVGDPLVGRLHFRPERRQIGTGKLHSGLLQLVDLVGFGVRDQLAHQLARTLALLPENGLLIRRQPLPAITPTV